MPRHTRQLILATMLFVIQGFILYIMNGDLATIVQNKDFDLMALIFSPVAAIIWVFREIESKND